MKTVCGIGIVVWFAAGLAGTSPASAQGELDRLESGIRASNGAPVMTTATAPRVYLGAFALDHAGGGVRLSSVRNGGPADHAGLHAQDLIVGAAGHKIRSLSDLSAVLNGLNPGDHLSLEFIRGNQPLRTEVTLGPVPLAAQPGQTPTLPPPSPGMGPTEGIPPPPGDVAPAPLPEGPAFSAPNKPPVPANSPQAQIDELRRRVDQLEQKIEELQRALAESRRK